jgi:SAM-dependent methyltransferase
MREFYEDLWGRLPEDLDPPVLALRRRLLLDHAHPGDRVLDLGCGEGTFTAIAAEAGAQPVGVDVADAALERARRRHPGLDFRRAPVEGPLPLEDASVDVVWCSEVIEHVADTARFLSEARRVLRRDGTLVLTTPNLGRLRRTLLALRGFEEHFDPLGEHLRFYTRVSLRDTLEDLGFAYVAISTAGPALRPRLLVATARRPGLIGS